MKLRFILNETKLILTAKKDLEPVLPKAEKALKIYLNRYGEDSPDAQAAINRYEFILYKYDNSYDQRFYFSYHPKEKNASSDEILDQSHEFYKYYDGGKTGYKIYKTPKDSIEAIPANASYGYRGMSWEEWQKTQKNKTIQSHGSQNFHNQTNLTFYGYKPETGESYAGSFAPMSFKPTPKKPGVIIAVPRKYLIDHTQNKNVPVGELAHVGSLPFNAIAEVYMLIMTKYKSGKFDLSVDWKGQVHEGSRANIGLGYAIRRLK